MSAPLENQFWKARSTHGRKPLFENAEDLWAACLEYFQWIEANPLIVQEPIKFQGTGTLMDVPKARPMTQAGLCNFLDINTDTWNNWKHERLDLSEVITRVEQVIFQNKFEGAAAGFFNANIIARDLGLADKQEHSGLNGSPVYAITPDMTAEEAMQAYADSLRAQDEERA